LVHVPARLARMVEALSWALSEALSWALPEGSRSSYRM
jgi:hypothetical protein